MKKSHYALSIKHCTWYIVHCTLILAFGLGFNACSDDDDDDTPSEEQQRQEQQKLDERDAAWSVLCQLVDPTTAGDDWTTQTFEPTIGEEIEDSPLSREVRTNTLANAAQRFANLSAKHFGFDRQNEPGAGAAGGLGYAFLQYMNAGCRSGIELLLEAVGFDALLQDASLVITGEGSADRQTLMGKLPFGILQSAKRHQVPVALIAGRIGDRQQLLDAGFAHVECINPPGLPLEEAMKPEVARQNIKTTVQRLLK